jgi:putative NADPH-quinone reductase
MGKRILVMQGHPDAGARHLCHALADAYAAGAAAAGHEVRRVEVGELEFAVLRSAAEWEQSPLPPDLAAAQAAIEWAEHLVIVFPLWLGDMPAMLKAFLEQVARPGFAFGAAAGNPFAIKRLGGRSARVIVTMGMPALVYRWYFRAHSVKSLERNILGFVGIAPVDETLIGSVGEMSVPAADKWLSKMRTLGRRAE